MLIYTYIMPVWERKYPYYQIHNMNPGMRTPSFNVPAARSPCRSFNVGPVACDHATTLSPTINGDIMFPPSRHTPLSKGGVVHDMTHFPARRETAPEPGWIVFARSWVLLGRNGGFKYPWCGDLYSVTITNTIGVDSAPAEYYQVQVRGL